MKHDIHAMYQRPLHDLGEVIDKTYSGIYSPGYEQQEIRQFMSKYYESQEGACGQADKFDLTNYYHTLIAEALTKVKHAYNQSSRIAILDIGCGFGSTTFPLFTLFPQAHVIASELSLSMLLVLKQKLEQAQQWERSTLIQLNAEDLDFEPRSFDLVVGAAILHHLFHPEKVIEKLAYLLKPGGIAIFFEPFENGMSLMGLIYQSILRHQAFFRKLQPAQKAYFERSVKTWQKMKNKDKNDPFFKGIDDKWLFSRHYFYELAEKFDFAKCIIFRLDKSDTPFVSLAKTHFAGNKVGNLPAWVYEVIQEYEDWFSADLKHDFLTEGGIIFQRSFA